MPAYLYSATILKVRVRHVQKWNSVLDGKSNRSAFSELELWSIKERKKLSLFFDDYSSSMSNNKSSYLRRRRIKMLHFFNCSKRTKKWDHSVCNQALSIEPSRIHWGADRWGWEWKSVRTFFSLSLRSLSTSPYLSFYPQAYSHICNVSCLVCRSLLSFR